MAIFNPFSTNEERQNFPRFSPMFKSSPSNLEAKPFRWSIDQLARLKPTPIDTDHCTLMATSKHSSDDDADRQKEIDKYFSQAVLPSPWLTSAPEKPSHASRQPKQVSFSLLHPPTAFIQQDCLVETQKRDSKTVDAGTQTSLTFPMTFDLEGVLKSLIFHTHNGGLNGSWSAEGDEEDGTGGADESKRLLRRKLFGQPERQNMTEEEMAASNVGPSQLSLLNPSTISSHNSSDPKDTPRFLHDDETNLRPSVQAFNCPHDRHAPFSTSLHSHTNDVSMDSSLFHSSLELVPFHSSMVVTPGGKLPGLSPIGEGVEPPEVRMSSMGSCEEQHVEPTVLQVSSIHCSSEVSVASVREGEEDKVDLILFPTNSCAHVNRKFTSTPNKAVTKRELATPFSCPVLKQPCTSGARHCQDNEHCPLTPHREGTCNSKALQLAVPQAAWHLHCASLTFALRCQTLHT